MEDKLKENEKYCRKTEGELLKVRTYFVSTQKNLPKANGRLQDMEENLKEKTRSTVRKLTKNC